MARPSYPIHRTRGLGSPNAMSIGGGFDDGDQSSIAEMSVDYSDGISSIAAGSAISNDINNISSHAAPLRLGDDLHTTPGGQRPTDSQENSDSYVYDPYASVVDSDSGGSPSLHLGSESMARLGTDAPDPPSITNDRAGALGMMKRLSMRFVDVRAVKDKQQPPVEMQTDDINKDGHKFKKGPSRYTMPAWLSDAPLTIRFVMLLSTALLVGASVMLIVIAIGTATEKRTNASAEFTPMDNSEVLFGFIPSVSQETMEPSLEPTLEPTFEVPPTIFSPTSDIDNITPLPSLSLEAHSDAPSHVPSSYLTATCQDSTEPLSYALGSGTSTVQSIDSCDKLLSDFRFFILESLCEAVVVGGPSSDATLVSDRCPRTCDTCGTTKTPSSAPSQTINIPTPLPSLLPSTDEPTARPTRPTSTRSTFFITGGHFKRSDDVGPLLRVLPYSDGSFLLHLGDMNRPQWRDCDKKSWKIALDIWLASSVPLFAIPGEDDWTHCEDPDDGWELWEEFVVGIDKCCWNDPEAAKDVSRQDGTIENWAFVQHGVLHIGLHLVPGPDIPNTKEWTNRLNANVEWLLDRVSASGESVEVICVYGHSTVEDESNRNFFESFAAAADMWNVPVIYFHQDDETEYPWTYERNLFGVSNFLRVGVREKLWPPLRVVIDTAANTFNLDNTLWHVGLIDNGSIFGGKLQVVDDGQ